MSAKLVFQYQVNNDRTYWVDFMPPQKPHIVGDEVEVEKYHDGRYFIMTRSLFMRPLFERLFKTTFLCAKNYKEMRKIINKIASECTDENFLGTYLIKQAKEACGID